MLRRNYFILLSFFLSLAFPSCRTWRGPKEYVEKNGLHSDKKPHEIAAEIGSTSKKQQRAYKKEMRKKQRKKNKKGYYGK